jgi:hypothetical protein
MRYDTSNQFASHLDITPGFYTISSYDPQTNFSTQCFLVPASGATDQYYIFTYSTFMFRGKEQVLGHTSDGYSAGYAYSGDSVGTFSMSTWYFIGQNNFASNYDGTPNYTPNIRKYTIQAVPYVTNGYIFIDVQTSLALRVTSTTSVQHVIQPPLHTDDYNKCILMLRPSTWGTFTAGAGGTNPYQRPSNFIKNASGSEFLFDSNLRTTSASSASIVAATPYTKRFFTTFYTTVLTDQFEWRYNTAVNMTWLLTVDLPDFWTYVNRP